MILLYKKDDLFDFVYDFCDIRYRHDLFLQYDGKE